MVGYFQVELTRLQRRFPMCDGLFEQFKGWYEKHRDYARSWKQRTGG
jgi:hypothetical protein